MNIFQKAIAKLFRIPEPEKRGYAGAARGTALTSGWLTSGTSADAEIWNGLKTLRDRARNLYQDDPYLKGLIDGLVDNVIDKGICLQSKVKMRRRDELDLEVNRRIEDLFYRWAENPDWCDVRGQNNLYDFQRIILTAKVVSGEILVRLVDKRVGNSPIPFALELIEADQLDDTRTGKSHNGNEIRMGVEIDSNGRPVAYWILPNHPGDIFYKSGKANGYQPDRVPADQILHIYNRKGMRPGQTRGVSALHSVLLRLRNLSAYEEAEVVKARYQACIGAFIESDLPDVDPELDEQGYPIEYLEPGLKERLRPGEKIAAFDPSSPNPNLPQFIKHLLRSVAKGSGVSSYSVTGDVTDANFSSMRTALLEERKRFVIEQGLLNREFNHPIFALWLDRASMLLSLPRYDLDPEFYCCDQWSGAGWQWVDPYKDLQATQLALKIGTTTLTDVLAGLGLDIEDVLARKKQELDLFAKYGLDYPVFGDSPAIAASVQEPVKEAEILPKKRLPRKQKKRLNQK